MAGGFRLDVGSIATFGSLLSGCRATRGLGTKLRRHGRTPPRPILGGLRAVANRARLTLTNVPKRGPVSPESEVPRGFLRVFLLMMALEQLLA